MWGLMRVEAVQRVRTHETTSGHCAARSCWLRTLMEDALGGLQGIFVTRVCRACSICQRTISSCKQAVALLAGPAFAHQ